PSVTTISNAMDVGAPSNFARMSQLFGDALPAFREVLTGYAFSDEETRAAIRKVHARHGYVMDPHGAVAFLGLHAYMQDKRELNGIFLETAHPAKFRDIVEEVLQKAVPVPGRLAECLEKPKSSIRIKPGLDALREILLGH
ncbi:MAG TPA: threonine synthase, partial [Anseongella sp.]|nr:threonine synthase [Anseongella sp.]